MVESPPAVKATIARYCEQLGQLGVRVSQVFLFGSHAKGTATHDSDIDLIVVSPDFAPLGLRERLELLGVAAARVLEPIQAYGVTPAELEQGRLSPFWASIVEREAVPVEA